MKKRMMCILSVVMLTAVLCLGCNQKENAADQTARKDTENTENTESTEENLKVVFLCNGNLGDRGFNDSAAGGIQMLEDEMGA